MDRATLDAVIDALYAALNLEGPATRAARFIPVDAGLDVLSHMERVRHALRMVEKLAAEGK